MNTVIDLGVLFLLNDYGHFPLKFERETIKKKIHLSSNKGAFSDINDLHYHVQAILNIIVLGPKHDEMGPNHANKIWIKW